jgi:hypothetical protein
MNKLKSAYLLMFSIIYLYYILLYVANVANEYINITIKKNIGKVM